MKKAVVLSSGGLDSTTCLGIAVSKYGSESVSAISVFYGQKHDKELECARAVADYYKVEHYEYDMSKIFQLSNCSLLKNSTDEIIHETYAEQMKESKRVTTYVPFRNGLLLSMATSIADSLFPDEEIDIYYGAHADDYASNAYADCSPEFTEALSYAINLGTYNKVNLVAPLINLDKAGVVKIGLDLGVPYNLTWSCYEGREKQCGTCATCLDRQEAFQKNGVTDPVPYEE